MSTAGYTLFHISATTSLTPTITTSPSNAINEICQIIKDRLLCDDLNLRRYKFWCTDGLRHELLVYCDDEGRDPKALEPNHRANAMADAGRFVTKDYNWIDDEAHNQKYKESQGSNHFFGDIFIVVNSGDPLPDMSIYGTNPLRFITTAKRPSADMIAAHNGEAPALFKTHYALAHTLTDEDIESIKRGFGAGLSKEEVMATCVSTAFVTYLIAPKLSPGAVYNPEFLNLLNQWGMLHGESQDTYDPREIDMLSVQRERRIFLETGNIGDIHLSDNHVGDDDLLCYMLACTPRSR